MAESFPAVTVNDMMEYTAPVAGVADATLYIARYHPTVVSGAISRAENEVVVTNGDLRQATLLHGKAAAIATGIRPAYDDIAAFARVLDGPELDTNSIKAEVAQQASSLIEADERLAQAEMRQAVEETFGERVARQADVAAAMKAERKRLGRPIRKAAALSGAVVSAALLASPIQHLIAYETANDVKNQAVSSSNAETSQQTGDALYIAITAGLGGFALYGAARRKEGRLIQWRAQGEVWRATHLSHASPEANE